MPRKAIGLTLLVAGLILVHYFIPRHGGWTLIGCYAIGFCGYVSLSKEHLTPSSILVLGILVRVLLFFGMPSLSDDYFRFIWDGELLQSGIHPFSSLPRDLYNSNLLEDSLTSLYQSLNSKDYFTIYPPISQLVFWLSALGNDTTTSVLIFRCILLVFEVGNILLLTKLSNHSHKIAWYVFNPLVILEVTGNLHFEGCVLFFILGTIYFIRKNQTLGAGVSAGLAVAAKIVPIILIPSIIQAFGWKHIWKLALIITATSLVCFTPIVSIEFVRGISDSLDLFFRNFEFNASLFFLTREMGFHFVGYDVIQYAGPLLTLVGGISILIYSWAIFKREQDIAKAFMITISIQLLVSTTVHPWYIIPMIGLCTLTPLRYPIVWSFTIFFTYLGYSLDGYSHPFAWIAIEYLSVLVFIAYESIYARPKTLIHE